MHVYIACGLAVIAAFTIRDFAVPLVITLPTREVQLSRTIGAVVVVSLALVCLCVELLHARDEFVLIELSKASFLHHGSDGALNGVGVVSLCF